ncbi:hypothetical protein BLOT_007267 [Blomia tropicalis]|nr:hypothetical protein BLOT_007267 [Blomia tropicalis]
MLKQDDGNHHYGTSKMNSFPEMIVLKLSCKVYVRKSTKIYDAYNRRSTATTTRVITTTTVGWPIMN